MVTVPDDTTVISASVETWIAEELDEHPDVDNRSALINRLLKDWLESGEDSEVAAYRRRLEQKHDKREKYEEKLSKVDRDINRLQSMIDKAERQEHASLTDSFEDYARVPADPDHPAMQELADEHGLDAKEVAEQHADYHSKELQDNSEPDLRSVQ